MKWPLTIILGLLLAQLGLPGGVDARPADAVPECRMACCAPQEPSCCDEPAAPPTAVDCACRAHAGRQAPVSPAPQPRETRVDLQLPVTPATAVLPLLVASFATPIQRSRMIALPSHNTVQALKGVWRT